MKNETKEKRIRHWPLWAKILFWCLSPVCFFLLSFFFLYGMMTFLDSVGIKENLLAPVAAGSIGFCYFVVLFLIERPFVRFERMSWWQYGLGAYGIAGLSQMVMWLLIRREHLAAPKDEDLEFFTYLFLTMAIYTAIALGFRLVEFLIETIIRKNIQKKNRAKLERYRELQKKSAKVTDTSAVFKNEE